MVREPFNPNLIRGPEDEREPAGKGAGPGRTTAGGGAKATARSGPLSVSQVTSLVARAIEAALPATVHVVGEISNFKRHSSGHLYLTLKDRHSELSCVMWRSAAAKLKFQPEDGMEVVATGGVEVFERAGRYQLYIRKIEPRGVGALELAFRQLCDKLEKEGLFDEGRKRPLPAYPRRIAIITSGTGAAIADMLRTLERRYPCVNVLVYPVRVQGDSAAGEIARAIARINANDAALGGVDLIIAGRGGGSLEDLWAFNEEVVARAIFASRISIISAVGHEVDVTIADLVADVRAATPTAAAEIAVPVLDEVLTDLDETMQRIHRAARREVDLSAARLDGLLQRGAVREPLNLVHRREQVVDELAGRMHRAVVRRLQTSRHRVERLEPIVGRIAPHLLLMRRAVTLRDRQHRLRWVMARRVADLQAAVADGTRRLERNAPHAALPRWVDRWDNAATALPAAMDGRLRLAGEKLHSAAELLAAMSHRSVLGRGFAITRSKRGRKIVRSVAELRDGDRVLTEVSDGEFESQVVNLKQLELFE